MLLDSQTDIKTALTWIESIPLWILFRRQSMIWAAVTLLLVVFLCKISAAVHRICQQAFGWSLMLFRQKPGVSACSTCFSVAVVIISSPEFQMHTYIYGVSAVLILPSTNYGFKKVLNQSRKSEIHSHGIKCCINCIKSRYIYLSCKMIWGRFTKLDVYA